MRRLLIVICLILSSGCVNRDGLSENEYGMILFWEVVSGEVTWDECTDGSGFRDNFMVPDFPENSFFVYRVTEDGDQLVAQECTHVDASTCSDSPLGLTFERDGDLFYFDEEKVVGAELAPGCRMSSSPRWEIDDRGQELFLDVSVTYGLEGGDACTGVDANVAATGSNEFGVDGCVATLGVVTDYYTRLRP